MKKNDKLVVLVGVIILILSSIGIYYWVPESVAASRGDIMDFIDISGELYDLPDAVTVSDCSPFYALVATPLAVHYNIDGEQEIMPLLIKNFDDSSRAVERAINDQIIRNNILIIDGSKSAKNVSLEIAKEYWANSDAALIIENNEPGYNFGVIATPLASYLSIPVIVTDEIDQDVMKVFTKLGVENTIICGENIEGYGNFLKFDTVEDIVNVSIELLLEKFGDIDYLTITNPVDAWPPEVLDNEYIPLGPVTMNTGATTELIKSIRGAAGGIVGTFTIPKDYKYALVKFEGINLNTENVDLLGDQVFFSCGPIGEEFPEELQKYEIIAGSTGGGGIPVRDSNGNIIEDKCYSEAVLYDRGGVEYQVNARPSWLASDTGEVMVKITVEKLSDPVYPMMKSLSATAPYLTAYHKGLIFGKPEFAFAADDNTLYMGERSPGFYMPRRNPRLADPSNDHIYKIHEQINTVLAKLAGITIEREYDIKSLQDHYKQDPINIALVGGATVIPQYIYESPMDPVLPPEDVVYYVGAGVPSDFIYGNIDPNPMDWSSQSPDLYSEYPIQENIVGRITGWDAQDASALIARTVFYDEIIDTLEDWKDNAVLQMGGGNDFQKPFIRYKIFGELLNLISRGEPMKMATGAGYLNGLALKNNVLDPLGFETEYLRENEATYQGFSNEAIDTLKKANLINRVLLSKWQIKKELGVDVVKGKELQENSNFILANAHGNQHMFGMGDVGMYSLGLGLPNGLLERLFSKVATILGFGPGLSLSDHGYYSTRNVENMDLGPSFLWIESCICGKIDGVYPTQGIGQAYLHSGCNAVIASTTSSNVPGGYIEPKNTKYDFPGQTLFRYIKASLNARKGIYPEQHFGFKIYQDLCEELREEDVSIGYAFREARNRYLPEDADAKFWWSPPLKVTGIRDIDENIQQNIASMASSDYNEMMDNKFMSFQEYTLYGDPAFVPYVPIND